MHIPMYFPCVYSHLCVGQVPGWDWKSPEVDDCLVYFFLLSFWINLLIDVIDQV